MLKKPVIKNVTGYNDYYKKEHVPNFCIGTPPSIKNKTTEINIQWDA